MKREQKDIYSFCWLTPQMDTKTQSHELHPGVSHDVGIQELGTSLAAIPGTLTGRKQGQKQSYGDSNWHSYGMLLLQEAAEPGVPQKQLKPQPFKGSVRCYSCCSCAQTTCSPGFLQGGKSANKEAGEKGEGEINNGV